MEEGLVDVDLAVVVFIEVDFQLVKVCSLNASVVGDFQVVALGVVGELVAAERAFDVQGTDLKSVNVCRRYRQQQAFFQRFHRARMIELAILFVIF